MHITMQPGTYVVAVSGGVDSMVLLDLLRLYPGVRPIVAHYDHGIRPDSGLDRDFVAKTATRHGLPFIYDEGHLGPDASEAVAREARYEFLHRVRNASGATAVVTAHHQDDVLETALINMLRGTGRKGLSSLKSTDIVVRPLLHASKREIRDYARRHGLVWHEDSTNQDVSYLRNHVRHDLLPRLSAAQRKQLVDVIGRMHAVNAKIDTLLAEQLDHSLNREWFSLLPHDIAREVMAAWLRMHNIRNFDAKTIERLTVGAKVAQPTKRLGVVNGYVLLAGRTHLALERKER